MIRPRKALHRIVKIENKIGRESFRCSEFDLGIKFGSLYAKNMVLLYLDVKYFQEFFTQKWSWLPVLKKNTKKKLSASVE